MNRRDLLMASTAIALLPGRGFAMPRFLTDEPFGPDTVETLARELAAQPYEPRPEVPAAWRDLTYDEYRTIWFNTSQAVWARTERPFRMDLFHPGLYYPRAVAIDVVQEGRAHRLAFDLSLFDRTDQSPELPVDETMGYSGLRLRTSFDNPDIFREFVVFQGASYFRAIGMDMIYGLSARGLALGTGDAEGEEFPDFTRFWVEEPAPNAETITVHALLDGPSVTGAYRFVIRPGSACVMDVEATLFPRRPLEHVGLGALTSMFLYDGTNRWRFKDFRPAVHDSDGLSIWNGAGEMIWRPLTNPTRLQVSSFVDQGPRGFGLMQRSRALEDFQDFEARYESRPSLWIEPVGDWGGGVVRLVEIPADQEIYDNVVAYWRPHDAIEPGAAFRFAYRMTWFGDPSDAPARRDVARVRETLIGDSFNRDRIVAAVDFAPHPSLDGDLEQMTAFISASRGEVAPALLQRNPETGGVRLATSFDPGDAEAIEFRAQIVRDGTAVSEVWIYRWTPE